VNKEEFFILSFISVLIPDFMPRFFSAKRIFRFRGKEMPLFDDPY
jgi:hypothetical protein